MINYAYIIIIAFVSYIVQVYETTNDIFFKKLVNTCYYWIRAQ